MKKIIILLILLSLLFPNNNKRARNILIGMSLTSFSVSMGFMFLNLDTPYMYERRYNEKFADYFSMGAAIFLCAAIPFDIEYKRDKKYE